MGCNRCFPNVSRPVHAEACLAPMPWRPMSTSGPVVDSLALRADPQPNIRHGGRDHLVLGESGGESRRGAGCLQFVGVTVAVMSISPAFPGLPAPRPRANVPAGRLLLCRNTTVE